MKIQFLKAIPIAEITQVFNRAFADYVIAFALSEQDLKAKIVSENIRLEYSLGIFDGEQLCGFILVGLDAIDGKLTAYNAGTGVIPECRGHHYTEKMYAQLLAELEKIGVVKQLLEVITTNSKAIAVYEKIGFRTTRTLLCFKGKVFPANAKIPIDIKAIESLNEQLLASFWDSEPAYQNRFNAIYRNKSAHQFLGAYHGDLLVGYLIFSVANWRVRLFGVHRQYRNKRIGHALFGALQQLAKEQTISLINLDAADTNTAIFLQKIGLEQTISQYEMALA